MTESIGFFGYTVEPLPWHLSDMAETWKPSPQYGGQMDLRPLSWHAGEFGTWYDGPENPPTLYGAYNANLLAVAMERGGSTNAYTYWLIGGNGENGTGIGQEHKRLTETVTTARRIAAKHPYHWNPPGVYHRDVSFGGGYLEPPPTSATGDWWMTKKYDSGRVVLCHTNTGRLYDMEKILGPEDFPGNKPKDYMSGAKIMCPPINAFWLMMETTDGYFWEINNALDPGATPTLVTRFGKGSDVPARQDVNMWGFTTNGYVHGIADNWSKYFVDNFQEPWHYGVPTGLFLDAGDDSGPGGHGPFWINGGGPESLPKCSPDHSWFVYLYQVGEDAGDKTLWWHGYSASPDDGGLIATQTGAEDSLEQPLDMGQVVWSRGSWAQWLVIDADPYSSIAELWSDGYGSWIYMGNESRPITVAPDPYRPFEAS